MERPERKPNRLAGYDYASHGAYFVTICTDKKRPIFWDKEDRHVGAASSRPQESLPFSQYGRLVEQAIQAIPNHYPGVFVDAYVVMPNHVHAIIRIERTDGGGRMISAPTLSTVVGQMKRWVSKQIGQPIWQRSFYDHIIRNEKEYLDDWNYIQENPAKWQEDDLFC